MKVLNQKTAEACSNADAMIPKDTTFNGDVETKSSIRIDGHVKGNVVAAGNVTVGADGSVEGGISGNEVTINGKVTGNLNARGAVQLSAGARLAGDLLASSITIEKGSFFKGMCIIADKQSDLPQEKTSGRTIALKTAVN